MTRARWAALAACVASLILHTGGLLGVSVRPPDQAGAPPVRAQLGNSFADMVQGTVEAEPPEPTPVETAVTLEPVDPIETVHVTPRPAETATAQAIETPEVASTPALRVEPAEQAQVPDLPVVETDAALPSDVPLKSEEVALPGMPEVTPSVAAESGQSTPVDPVSEPRQVTALAITPEPVSPAEPVEVQPADAVVPAPSTPPEPTAADVAEDIPPPERPTTETTAGPLRPRMRPEDLKVIERSPPSPQTAAAQQRRRSGNGAPETARRGSEATTPGRATTASQNQGETADGNAAAGAAAAAYQDRVYRQISRTRRQRPRRDGQAVVFFVINASGGLSQLRIQQSSGFVELDDLALSHLRRSAPFPPPPPGAKTQYAVPIRYVR
ncbi:MAG: TonB family protein [Pseudomonadota bacterium]